MDMEVNDISEYLERIVEHKKKEAAELSKIRRSVKTFRR